MYIYNGITCIYKNNGGIKEMIFFINIVLLLHAKKNTCQTNRSLRKAIKKFPFFTFFGIIFLPVVWVYNSV